MGLLAVLSGPLKYDLNKPVGEVAKNLTKPKFLEKDRKFDDTKKNSVWQFMTEVSIIFRLSLKGFYSKYKAYIIQIDITDHTWVVQFYHTVV